MNGQYGDTTMKLLGFSIYDTKALAFMPPFFMPSIGLGVRAFGDVLRDPSSPLAKHPRDYELFKVGDFDDSTGAIGQDGLVTPFSLCTGAQALEDR